MSKRFTLDRDNFHEKNQTRPIVHFRLTRIDLILELITALLLFVTFVFVIVSWQSLPETVPVHFDAKGRPDGYGGRNSIFIGPLVAMVLYVLLTVINQKPYIFNYPVKITAENAAYQYKLASQMMRLVKLSLVLTFSTVTWTVVHSARFGEMAYSGLLLISVFLLNLLPLVFYFAKAFSNPSKGDSGQVSKTKKQRKYKLY